MINVAVVGYRKIADASALDISLLSEATIVGL
jgi:hypothetical protein